MIRLYAHSPELEFALQDVARMHKKYLPHTTASRAGIDCLVALYRVLVAAPECAVFWDKNTECFAAGTTDILVSEKRIRDQLGFSLKTTLGFYLLFSPAHFLARKFWQQKFSLQGAYILTLGARPGFGEQTLGALEAFFADSLQTRYWVDSELRNERALRFYQKKGFVVVSQIFANVLLQKSVKN